MDNEIVQFKSLVELREYIIQFDGYRARPTQAGEHPTLYREGDTCNSNTSGVRDRDYFLMLMVLGCCHITKKDSLFQERGNI